MNSKEWLERQFQIYGAMVAEADHELVEARREIASQRLEIRRLKDEISVLKSRIYLTDHSYKMIENQQHLFRVLRDAYETKNAAFEAQSLLLEALAEIQGLVPQTTNPESLPTPSQSAHSSLASLSPKTLILALPRAICRPKSLSRNTSSGTSM